MTIKWIVFAAVVGLCIMLLAHRPVNVVILMDTLTVSCTLASGVSTKEDAPQ